MTRAFSSLAIPQYRWFMLSTVAGSMAYQSQQIAMGWLAYYLTKSPFALGLVMISWGIPEVAFSLVGGVIADTRNRRHIMALMMALSLAAVLVVAILVTTNQVALWHLLAIGAVSATASTLNMPSRQAFVYDLVGAEHLRDAIAINSSGFNTMRLLSPAVSGFLIGAVGVDAVYYLVAICYLISALTLLLPLRSVPAVVRKSAYPARDLVDGFRYVWQKKAILWLLVVALTTMFVGLPFRNLMPAFAVESLGQGPEGYGLLMSTVGLGALVGSLGAIFLGKVRRPRLLLMAAALVWGISLTAFGLSGNLASAVALAMILGLVSTGSSIINNILIQTDVDPGLRGRVMSFYMLTFGMSSLGTLPFGGLAELVGTATALCWSGLTLVIIAIPLALWGRTMLTEGVRGLPKV
ncbi:MAG: MFS transporter [Dehalococcoidia bacterium]|nr:MFS transporter [Dehalococcoidia bacterium]